MKKTIAASPFIRQPMTIPYRVILVEVTLKDGTKTYHTHNEQVGCSRANGSYFGPDFAKAYASWMDRCKEQFRYYDEGIATRPEQFFFVHPEEWDLENAKKVNRKA